MEDGEFHDPDVFRFGIGPTATVMGSYDKADASKLTPEQLKELTKLKSDEVYFDDDLAVVRDHLASKDDRRSQIGAQIVQAAMDELPTMNFTPPLQRERSSSKS